MCFCRLLDLDLDFVPWRQRRGIRQRSSRLLIRCLDLLVLSRGSGKVLFRPSVGCYILPSIWFLVACLRSVV